MQEISKAATKKPLQASLAVELALRALESLVSVYDQNIVLVYVILENSSAGA
jgi:hypothetical protein